MGEEFKKLIQKWDEYLIEKRLAKLIKKEEKPIIVEQEEENKENDEDEEKIEKYSSRKGRKTIFPKSIINDEEEQET